MTASDPEPQRIKLSTERRQAILGRFQELHERVFDESCSQYRAEQVLEFFVKQLGPAVYNQAIQDARGFVMRKLEDLDVEVYEPEP